MVSSSLEVLTGLDLLSVVARFVVGVGVIALLRLSCLTMYVIRLH